MHKFLLSLSTLTALIAPTLSFAPHHATVQLTIPSCDMVRTGTKPTLRTKTSSAASISKADDMNMNMNIDVGTNNILDENDTEKVGHVIFLLPHDADTVKSNFGSRSPYGNPSIQEASEQLQRKVNWFSDGKIDAEIIVLPKDNDGYSNSNIKKDSIINADALIAFHLQSDSDLKFAEDIFQTRRKLQKDNMCQFALNCNVDLGMLSQICGPYDPLSPSLSSELLPWTASASGKRLEEQMTGLFNRWTSDDFTYAIMLFFNQFSGSEVDWVKYSIDATWEKGLVQNAQEFYSMATKCGDCVAKCVADETCKKCLDELTAVDTSDQVASYRTIVSFESELLKDFSFCILQKNNIFNCKAEIPKLPYVTPLAKFRGEALTKDVARQILIGHLNDEKALEGLSLKTDISWKVAAGANVAYDQFPSQNQIFYESINGNSMWYDPVFRVETIDGRNVWCKRHYSVRDGPVPGTFRFSVLDNGVTSNEYWTIVDVADDLSYIIFHYAGAAGAVGQQYLGGLLCTADGTLPAQEKREPIYAKLRSAGIDPWELFVVDNRVDSDDAIDAGPPPLDYFRKDILQKKTEMREKQNQS